MYQYMYVQVYSNMFNLICVIRSPNLNSTFLSNGEVNIRDKARLQPVVLWKYDISIPESQKLASDSEHSPILSYICFI